MDRAGQILGKTLSVTGPAALFMLESTVCEGITIPGHWSAKFADQLFGRKVQLNKSDELSFLSGLALGGLRTAAFLSAHSLSTNLLRIQDLARKHTPALLFCLTDDTQEGFPSIKLLEATGCFVFSASSIQEAIDLAIPAHELAEQALIPGIILVPTPPEPDSMLEINFPAAESIVQQLGEPDDQIPSPTPAQQIIFGKSRRRIPNWFHFDHPTITGSHKDGLPLALELAAHEKYFKEHLPTLIAQIFNTSNLASTFPFLGTYKTDDADYLILSWGQSPKNLHAAVDQFRATESPKVGVVQIAQLFPLPDQALISLFSGKKAVTVLEPISTLSGGTLLSGEKMSSLKEQCGRRSPEWFIGSIGSAPGLVDFYAVFQNMMPKGKKHTGFFAGIQFARSGSDFPQHVVLLQTIDRVYPEAKNWALDYPQQASNTHSGSRSSNRLPWTIRRLKDLSPPYARTTRFYHDVAALHAYGALEESVADPFQAIPSIPAGSAGLAGTMENRHSLPYFTPEHCTGCGDCLVYCPHAALPPIALRIEDFLRGGMEIARKKGNPLTQLTPLLKNLGIIAGQLIAELEQPVQHLSDFLPETFQRLKSQMGLKGEKLEKISAEINSLLEILSPVPMAITDTFFHQAELHGKGQGAFFSLSLDTQACTGCGICADVCTPGALEMMPETAPVLQEAEQVLNIWEQLPDTKPDIISQFHKDPDYDSLAAILLSRYNYLSLSGPGLKASIPSKIMLHLVTAVTESVMQPRIAAGYKEAETLIADLSENIRKKLVEALPSEDSLGLIGAIADAGGRKLPLDEIIGTLGKLEHLKLIDTAALQRKIQLVNDLKDLLWLLREGPTGIGRSHFGLTFLGHSADEAGPYPFHPFHTPVMIAPDNSPDLGIGQFEAYLRHALDNIRLFHRAKLEIKNKYRPEFHAGTIAELNWEKLSAEEKALMPPLLLVCTQNNLPAGFLERIRPLFAQDFPIKVIVLDSATPAPGPEVASGFATRAALLETARISRNVFIAMDSLGSRPSLFNGLLQGIQTSKPALFILQTPDTAKQETKQSLASIPQLALHSRTFPAYTFDPNKADLLLATGVSLESNPASRADWPEMALPIQEGDEEKEQTIKLTYANWLFTLEKWQDHFTEVSEEGANSLDLDQFLQLSPKDQDGKKALIRQRDNDGTLKQFEVSEQVIEATQVALRAWNYLRETAGTLSAHPHKLWEEAQQTLAEQYEQQVQQLEAGFEERLKQMEVEMTQKIRMKLRDKLVLLAKKAPLRPKTMEQEN